jgi:hypothetical protein
MVQRKPSVRNGAATARQGCRLTPARRLPARSEAAWQPATARGGGWKKGSFWTPPGKTGHVGRDKLIEVPMFGLLLFAFLGAASAAPDAVLIPSKPIRGNASDYHFENDIMASKPNDQGVYVLLGSGFLRPTTFGDRKNFISDWLQKHPKAIATPISRSLSTNTITHKMMEFVYIWLDDGTDSLNVDLVRSGIFAGGTMYDMVDNERGLDRLLESDPKMADARAQIAREKAAAPQDRSERLISDGDYNARIKRINDADRFAREKKLGIWSDAMKEEREADGLQ